MDTKYLEIIKAPVITEKSMIAAQNGEYIFKVDTKAKKPEIKNAIEKIFNVKVVSISTINVKPKTRRFGRYYGLSNKYKKAIVKLQDGQTIELN